MSNPANPERLETTVEDLYDRAGKEAFDKAIADKVKIEEVRNKAVWELMTTIRENERLNPVERYALGMIGTTEALGFFKARIQSRIYDTVGQAAIGLGVMARGDTFVYGESTGELFYEEDTDDRGKLTGTLGLRLGKTFSSVNPDSPNFRSPVGMIHDSYDLLIHSRELDAFSIRNFANGSSTPEGKVGSLPVNIFGELELLKYDGVGGIADIITAAKEALGGKREPDWIYWNPGL